jgi:hypothetical protein
MANEIILYNSLLTALQRMFGQRNAGTIMAYLEQEGVIHDEKVDMQKMELVLRSLFGLGASAITLGLFVTQKKSARSLR